MPNPSDRNPQMTTDNNPTLPTGTWNIDPAATSVTIAVKKMALFTVTADLAVNEGTIQLADGNLTVAATVDAASYSSPNDKRNEHVRGSDFLDAENHPTISFAAGDLTLDAQAPYNVAGNVTVKGRTAPITFVVSDVQTTEDDATFSATANVDRAAIGIDKMPSFMIGKTLQLSITASASRTPAN